MSIYDDFPEDDEKAFIRLAQHFRTQLDDGLRDNDQNSYDAYCKRKYMSAVIAAAKSLNIPGIQDYTTPFDDREVWNTFEGFEHDVMNLVIQIEINHARRSTKYSVAFDDVSKRKIRHHIEQIRRAVEGSDLPQSKRDAIYKKLSDLTLEIDRSRTRFEIVADAVRGVARLGGDVGKYVKAILGEIDEAKDKEPQTSLPSPEERRPLEPPRRQLPSPQETRRVDLDDDIPF